MVGELCMENNTEFQKDAANSKVRIFYIIALCFILLSCQKQPSDTKRPDPKPPDLSRCTRLEVICSKPIMKLLRPLDNLGSDFFNAEQMEYLQTTRKFIIDDKNDIRQIAAAIHSGTFEEGGTKEINHVMLTFNKSIVGYHNDKRIATINMYLFDFILDGNNQRFNYDSSLPSLFLFVPENIKPSILRVFCAGHMDMLWNKFFRMPRSKKAYPIPTNWCDICIRYIIETNEISEKRISKLFKCPCASEGKCHYAMNPNCNPNSPDDMVLIFETKDGWNQHGGPELFTFDNHEPRGGCVLLNDGTVKFIRTEEELNALRWK